MRYLIVVFVWFLFVGCADKVAEAPSWPEITAETKPWTRWWWHGSAVTREGITSELESLKKAGIGGVEITPIFGVKGEEEHFIEYLSDEWMQMLLHTLKEADRLELGVDLATGTGWPFGGPWIGENHAPKNIVFKTYQIKAGEILTESVGYTQEPLVRAVGKSTAISDIKYPIAANDNLQELALDQVRFPIKLPLVTLMAFGSSGEVIDLTELVKEGKLQWQAPDGEWELIAGFQGWHGKMVERAAPGGEGNVIDHFSKDALRTYLAIFDSALKGQDIKSLRAFFNDSYEVDDARGEANWTPGFFKAFQELHGYDLREYIPALLGRQDEETNQRVLTDYRTTIDQLIYENFTSEWKKWGHQYDAVIRNQAHGSPANILDLYAEVDIPETEGTEMLKIKFASSAANVTLKKLASSESATWLKDHFQSSLADVRHNMERYFLGGINHVFYHGTAYSPKEATWPGWLFYAAIHANDRNTWWDDFGKLNGYIARVQSFMQQSQPDNDLLVYFPVYDRYAEEGHGLLEHFDIRGNFYKSAVKQIGDTLLERGVSFDLISDRQIQDLNTREGKLQTGGVAYKAILVPETKYMPLTTLQKLLEFARSGVSVLFHEQLPQDVPGLSNLKVRQQQFESLKGELSSQSTISASLDDLLKQGEVPIEILVQDGLQFYRKSYQGNSLYYLVNWTDQPIEKYVSLAKGQGKAFLFDPMTSEKGVANTKGNSVYIQLRSGESTFVLTSKDRFDGKPFPYFEEQKAEFIDGPWTLSFIKGGPDMPSNRTMESLTSWTTIQDSDLESFSGTARYETTFTKPLGDDQYYRLDLGEVYESARVYLNGQPIDTLIGPEYSLVLSSQMLKSENKLRIEVSNLMANRIRYMDLNGLEYKRFYNVNFPAHDTENRKEGLFHADHWKPLPSGLMGPVTLMPLIERPF